MSQTVYDIETQFSKVSNTESSETVMSGMKVNKRTTKTRPDRF